MEERILNFVLPHISAWGYYVVFVMAFLETSAFVGLVVPGETVIVLAGLLGGSGVLNVGVIICVASAGAILGDTVGYFLGYRYGDSFFRAYGHHFFLKPEYLDQARQFFSLHGGKTVFLGRFMGWLRAFAPVVAGISRMPYYRFLVANVCGGVAWVTVFSLVGYFVGNSWRTIEEYIGRAGVLALIAGASAVCVYLRVTRQHRRADLP
jgi:membrane protein DedA with SNARE-associated domain